MRNANKLVVFLCMFVITMVASGAAARASSATDLDLAYDPFGQQAHLEALKKQTELEQQKIDKEEKQRADEAAEQARIAEANKVITHTVKSGETLSSIGAAYNVSWHRLFDKNLELSDPNVLSIGSTLTIPKSDEQLIERVIAEITAPTSTMNSAPTPMAQPSASRVQASSSGNTYAPGYCTWYAKNRRPDLPNRMGNAISWVSSAAAQGFATGSTPQSGAIGQQGNHVVYVESVNGDGTITVSEMNYKGLYIVSSRTVSATNFHYIY